MKKKKMFNKSFSQIKPQIAKNLTCGSIGLAFSSHDSSSPNIGAWNVLLGATFPIHRPRGFPDRAARRAVEHDLG